LYSLKKDHNKKEKYRNRLDGFIHSLKGLGSNKRL